MRQRLLEPGDRGGIAARSGVGPAIGRRSDGWSIDFCARSPAVSGFGGADSRQVRPDDQRKRLTRRVRRALWQLRTRTRRLVRPLYVLLGLLVVLSLLVAPAIMRFQQLQREPISRRREILVMRAALGALSLCLLVVAASLLIQVLR